MIVSKENRDGVDVVIEQLQQRWYNQLLTFWSSNAIYNSYPRANKNYRDDNILPEISLDKKNYSEVLSSDKFSVTSFFIGNDTREFEDDSRRIKHSISIIFQADLVKLYGATNRADEKFNMDVLRVLKKDNAFIFGNIEIIEGVDKVYEDFTISGDLKKRVNLTDMSHLHVVRFTFDVIYKPNCNVNIPTVCAPVVIQLDAVLIETIASGGTLNIIVVNQDGDAPSYVYNPTDHTITVQTGGGSSPINVIVNGVLVLDQITTDQEIKVWQENADVEVGFQDGLNWRVNDNTNGLNGSPVTSTPNDEDHNVEIVDSVDATVTPTIVTDNKNLLKVSIANSPITINSVPATSVKSQQTKNIPVVASNNAAIGVWNGIGQKVVVSNTTIDIEDSAGNVLYAESLIAETSNTRSINDTQVSLNGNNLTVNKAQTNKAMTIQRANGDPVTVTPVTDSETVFLGTVPDVVPVINSATIYKSGAVTSVYTGDDGNTQIGAGTDWYTLDYLNFFGTNKRFTGTTGGYQGLDLNYYDVNDVATTYALAFPNTIKIDWAYWNNGNGNVYMWYDTPFSSTGTNALANEPYTLGGFGSWRVPNIPQLRSLFNYDGVRTLAAMMQYPPFNYANFATVNRFWTCNPTNTGALINFNGSETLVNNGVGTTCRVFAYRIGNTSEL